MIRVNSDKPRTHKDLSFLISIYSPVTHHLHLKHTLHSFLLYHFGTKHNMFKTYLNKTVDLGVFHPNCGRNLNKAHIIHSFSLVSLYHITAARHMKLYVQYLTS